MDTTKSLKARTIYFSTVSAISLLFLLTAGDARSLVSTHSQSDSEYILKFFTNQAAYVFIDGLLVSPKHQRDGIGQVHINSCEDILFILHKTSQAIPTGLSAFLVHSGRGSVRKGNAALYATRQGLRGFVHMPTDAHPEGEYVDSYVLQRDPAFDETKISPLFAIIQNLTAYLDPIDDITAAMRTAQLSTYLRGAAEIGYEVKTEYIREFLDVHHWRAAEVVDSVLKDSFPLFKKFYKEGAQPLNWRDGFLKKGLYALKICNPLCYPSDDAQFVMRGCYARTVF